MAAETHRIEQLPPPDELARIVELLGDLYQRPQYSRSDRDGSGYRELPMVCLVRPDEHAGLLQAITAHLRDASAKNGKPYWIPHAFVDDLTPPPAHRDIEPAQPPPPSHQDVEHIRGILDGIVRQLANCKYPTTGSLRFPRWWLISWLMDQGLDEHEQPRRISELRSRLHHRSVTRRISNRIDAGGSTADLPLGFRLIIPALSALSWLGFWIASSGRVPVLSGIYRWFLRQPYLAPKLSGSFLRFAARLLRTGWRKEEPAGLLKFLTNAFLEDLRRAYPRPPRLKGIRRTTNAIVLLDNISRDNGGYRLLNLINDVRSETGQSDPLLVVSASRRIPPYARETADGTTGHAHRGVEAGDGYRAWRGRLHDARRKRTTLAWYLPITTASAGSGEPPPALPKYTVHKPPWWGKRITVLTVVAVLVIGLMAGYVTRSKQHCGNGLEWPGLHPTLYQVNGECVGITDGSDPIFQPSDPLLEQVRERLYTQNQMAEDKSRAEGRPLVTLAYLGSLTSSSDAAGNLVANREELAGVAVAQFKQLHTSGRPPLVRILLANAGKDMLQGPQVAEQLGHLARSDPSLVGVIGLDRSSEPTRQTIRALTRAGLPMVAGPLTADDIGAGQAMYYQVAPRNSRQAAIAAELASRLRATDEYRRQGIPRIANRVRVYYSRDPAYAYSQNLRNDITAAMRRKNFDVESQPFSLDEAREVGKSSCGYPGLVYYAARGIPEFDAFLAGVAASCAANPPLILGDDDTSRYVADRDMRLRNSSVPFLYQSSAVGPTTSNPAAEPQLSPTEFEFYSELNRQFPFEASSHYGRSLDGHAALAYDATRTMLEAVQYLAGDPPVPITPAAVWRGLSDVGAPEPLQGATGVIDFGGDVRRQVPRNKPAVILQVLRGEVQRTVISSCGATPDARRPLVELRCPVD